MRAVGRMGPVTVAAGDLFRVDTSTGVWRVVHKNGRTLAQGKPRNWTKQADFLNVTARRSSGRVEVKFVLDRSWKGNSEFGVAFVTKVGQGEVPTQSVKPAITSGGHTGSFSFKPRAGVTKFFLFNSGDSNEIPTSKSYEIPR